MAQRPTLSPIQQAKKRMADAKRREDQILAGIKPEAGTHQTQLSEEDAKRIAAALTQILKD